MTNERKADEISDGYDYLFDKRERDASYYSALEMAEWKDQQFKEYLEKKLNEARRCKMQSIGLFPNDVIRFYGAIEVVNEIINELFPEQEQDNLDRED